MAGFHRGRGRGGAAVGGSPAATGEHADAGRMTALLCVSQLRCEGGPVAVCLGRTRNSRRTISLLKSFGKILPAKALAVIHRLAEKYNVRSRGEAGIRNSIASRREPVLLGTGSYSSGHYR